MRASFTTFIFVLLGLSFGWSQKQTPLDIALRYMEQQHAEWGLEATDIVDMVVSDQYNTKHNGVTHIYLKQRHASFEVYNAINGVHIMENGQVAHATNRFVAGLQDRINTTTAGITALQAIESAAQEFGLTTSLPLRLIEKKSEHEYLYEGGGYSQADITVKLVYQPLEDGTVHLAWNLALELHNSLDIWDIRIDAVDGSLLKKDNLTLYCSFPVGGSHTHTDECGLPQEPGFSPVEEVLTTTVTDGATYNVFALPTESPNFGDRELIVEPSDPVASPYGWHDTNGQDGPEFTITRGNNAHAFQGRNGNNSSQGDEPNGGNDLYFDSPLDLTQEPSEFTDAATVQLFYMTNIMHDLAYSYGMDEDAGAFQETNYSGASGDGDPVIAYAQDKANIDPSSTTDLVVNNAVFQPTPDGFSGRMRMFEWDRSSSELFRVLSPDPLAGSFDVSTATFGAVIGSEPIDGIVAQAFDGSNNANLVCDAVINPEDIDGKIALVDRGDCWFEQKVLNAQNGGAIAVIICNFEEALVGMGGVPEVEDPTIPAVMLRNSDCQQIKAAIAQGTDVEVRFQFEDANTGPDRLDGTIDNGIIAHEYGHGISDRLTGGPNTVTCMGNDENMKEGWSDFFTLITGQKPGDTGETPRGIASYASSANPNGGGLRRKSYSTDFAVNDQTYRDIVNTGGPGRDAAPPHPLGEIWASLIWDLYWAFTDEYGYDEDLYNGTGGNNMAIQLVMDGMKLQPCSPGFEDGRDAIIAADLINNGGANECLIWEVFARRGFGWGFDQGSVANRNDGQASFETRPSCIKEMKIAKFMTADIDPGEEITVILQVRNDTDEAQTGVVVTDDIPQGATFLNGTATGGAIVTATDQLVTLDIGNMAAGTQRTLSYRLATSPDLMSTRVFFDDFEDGGFTNFFFDAITGVNVWELTTDAYSGGLAWRAPNATNDNDQILRLTTPFTISGSQPALRFFHKYNTETGYDGGIIEVSTDGGTIWEVVPNEQIFKNNTQKVLGYSAFAIPFLDGFTGNQNDWIDTYVDMSPYNGQDVLVRFRFGSDDQVGANGWFVDDVEFMNVFNYNSEACVNSDQSDQACAIAESKGTIVSSNGMVNAEELEARQLEVSIFPNPANAFLNVAVTVPTIQEVTVSLTTADGKVLSNQMETVGGSNYLIPVDVSQLPGGFYFVRIQTDEQVVVEKVIIE